MNSNSNNYTIILGGGFLGLFTVLHLRQQNYSHPIILIDKNKRFTFKPLLYDLLSQELDESQVCPRYTDLLEDSGVKFVPAAVQEIDLHSQKVKISSTQEYSYDNLVLANGSPTGYFGVKGAKENTFTFRDYEDAIALQKHLINCLQKAIQTTDAKKRRHLLTVAIVGAGPSGVELAATLADVVPNWYMDMGGVKQEVRIIIINRGSEILSGDTNECFQKTAQEALQNRNIPVELQMNASVTKVESQRLEFERNKQHESLEAATIIWMTGTTTHPLIESLPIASEKRDKKGRLQVLPTLQLPEFPYVFAGGDCATPIQNSQPPLAQVAYQQGATIANNLKALSMGNSPKDSSVSIRGSLMKFGIGEAGANLFNKAIITGESAHFIRQSRYLTTLPTPVHNFQAVTEWLTDEIFSN
ncbi:MAG: NAD(P)/FAD-dependent oxidoreductase [Cyanobacteriota bacterium]|nr:NAD(P)/FAD-dependent oxidoreductase [Cyanobacteriota bacterium]